MKIALSIAGSDSGGGAGIQADLLTFAAHGIHGTSAITAITAQNTVAVTAWQALEPALVRAQIEAVADDMTLSAVKTGMLANRSIIEEVASVIKERGFPNLVVDPVMVAKSGDRLLEPEAEQAYLLRLFPLATLITPNIPEAEALLSRRIQTVEDMRSAALALRDLGCRAVLVKGGHLEGDPVDVLWDGTTLHNLATQRIDTKNTHGTGCTYSAAIASRLAYGHDVETSVRGAKQYLTIAIQESYSPGRGHGPVRHLNSGAVSALGRSTGPHKRGILSAD
jgi:hydroxymethylpyrimidine/phosphomethylpyrimidine kinase